MSLIYQRCRAKGSFNWGNARNCSRGLDRSVPIRPAEDYSIKSLRAYAVFSLATGELHGGVMAGTSRGIGRIAGFDVIQKMLNLKCIPALKVPFVTAAINWTPLTGPAFSFCRAGGFLINLIAVQGRRKRVILDIPLWCPIHAPRSLLSRKLSTFTEKLKHQLLLLPSSLLSLSRYCAALLVPSLG